MISQHALGVSASKVKVILVFILSILWSWNSITKDIGITIDLPSLGAEAGWPLLLVSIPLLLWKLAQVITVVNNWIIQKLSPPKDEEVK